MTQTLQVAYERRGTMVYTEETRPGKAKFIADCATPEQAQAIVDLLNKLAGVTKSEKSQDADKNIQPP